MTQTLQELRTKEKNFEEYIESYFLSNDGGYTKGSDVFDTVLRNNYRTLYTGHKPHKAGYKAKLQEFNFFQLFEKNRTFSDFSA